MNESFCGFRNVPGEIEFLGENVGGAAGEERERDAVAVLMAGEAVDDFVERAVATAGDDKAAIFGGGAGGDFGGVARAGGFGEVGVNAARGEGVARFVEQAATAVAAGIAAGCPSTAVALPASAGCKASASPDAPTAAIFSLLKLHPTE